MQHLQMCRGGDGRDGCVCELVAGYITLVASIILATYHHYGCDDYDDDDGGGR